MSILSVDNISPIGSGTSVTVNSAATLVLTNANSTGVVTATTFSGSGASLTNLNGSNIASGTVPVARIGTGTKNTSTFYRGDGTFATATTINNNATTKFITGTNNANELDCEANLSYNNSTVTFSSSNFLVDKSTNPTISAKETSGNKEVQLRANTTGGLLRTAGSYPLVLGTNQTERLRIDSDGRVGIKNTNMSSFNTGMDDLVIGNGVSNTSPGMTIFSHATDIGTISFRDSADTGISGLIQYRHLESPPYMRFMVEGTQRMSITTHGGIAFNSDTAAANTMDDYEEGTWTATLSGNSSPANVATNNPTTTRAVTGTYRKIGSLVHVQALWTNLQYNGSNDMHNHQLQHITGIPFTSGNASGTSIFTAPLGYSRGIYGRYSNTIIEECVLYFWMGTASTTVYLQASQIVQNSPGTLYHTVSNSSSSMYYAFNMTYHTN